MKLFRLVGVGFALLFMLTFTVEAKEQKNNSKPKTSESVTNNSKPKISESVTNNSKPKTSGKKGSLKHDEKDPSLNNLQGGSDQSFDWLLYLQLSFDVFLIGLFLWLYMLQKKYGKRAAQEVKQLDRKGVDLSDKLSALEKSMRKDRAPSKQVVTIEDQHDVGELSEKFSRLEGDLTEFLEALPVEQQKEKTSAINPFVDILQSLKRLCENPSSKQYLDNVAQKVVPVREDIPVEVELEIPKKNRFLRLFSYIKISKNPSVQTEKQEQNISDLFNEEKEVEFLITVLEIINKEVTSKNNDEIYTRKIKADFLLLLDFFSHYIFLDVAQDESFDPSCMRIVQEEDSAYTENGKIVKTVGFGLRGSQDTVYKKADVVIAR